MLASNEPPSAPNVDAPDSRERTLDSAHVSGERRAVSTECHGAAAETKLDELARSHGRIGPYEVLRRLGRGGMGTVYLVRLERDGGFSRLFALKVLRAHLTSDERAAQSLLDEARIASRLNHANVVGVVDTGQHEGQPYVVMEYVDGLSLAELLEASPGGARADLVVPILLDALAGLGAVHGATEADGSPLSVVHHDVSPHNFIVGLDGVARVSDFGIAGFETRADTRVDRGKPAYLAPERIAGGAIDARSDLFSLGVLMWNALTGQRLFDGTTPDQTVRRVLHAPIAAPSHVAPSPACLDAVCLRALGRDPQERYQSAEEMYDDLRRVAATHDLLGSPAELSNWVRSVMASGDLAPPSAARSAADLGPQSDGSTMVLPTETALSTGQRILRMAAMSAAVGALLAVVFSPGFGRRAPIAPAAPRPVASLNVTVPRSPPTPLEAIEPAHASAAMSTPAAAEARTKQSAVERPPRPAPIAPKSRQPHSRAPRDSESANDDDLPLKDPYADPPTATPPRPREP